MSLAYAKWIHLDPQSLEDDGSNNVRVKVNAAGAIERTANGVNVKALGITNAMLAGSIAFAKLADSANIARLDQGETIVGLWDFPAGVNAPTINGKEISTKEYVDTVAAGLDPKDSCRLLSNVNQTLSGVPGGTIDGVTPVADDRILLINQTDGKENGIWIIKAGAWVRPADFDTGNGVSSAYTFIEEGTANQDSGWTCTNNVGSDVVGTDSLVWTQFSGAGSITAGNGLDKTGNTLFVKVIDLISGGSAEIDGDKLDIDYSPTGYTPSTTPSEVDSTSQLTAHLAGLENAIGALTQPVVERFTLVAGDITNKYVTLANVPASATRVILFIAGAGNQQYSDDYHMDSTNTDRLTWSGDGLDGLLATGDKLTVLYDV